MKILHIAPNYIPAYCYGGPIKSVHELSVKLVESGIDVTVFTTNAGGAEHLDVPVARQVDINGVKVFYFPVEKPRSYFRSPFLSDELKNKIALFDLVHIHWLYVYTTMVAARECRRSGIPYVISPRGMLDPNAISRKSTLKKKIYISLVEKRNLENAGAVHFTSADELALAKKLGISIAGFIVPNGLNLTDYPESTGPDEKAGAGHDRETVLFLSRIDPQKGIDILIDAFRIVTKERPNANLVIAGPDNSGYLRKIRDLVSRYGLNGKVIFRGMLEGEEKNKAFNEASVFVLPSYSENFGIVIAEAMAFCKPVVITNRVNICHDVSEYGAGFITSCDHREVARSLIRILEDPSLGKKMGMNGRRLVEDRFTWDKAAGKMINVYEDILKQR